MGKIRMELLGCGEVTADPRWRMKPHFHPFHELIAVKSGRMLLKTRAGEAIVHAGDILFYEAGLIHEEISKPEDPVNTVFLSFTSDQILPALPLHLHDSEGRVVEMLGWMLRDHREARGGEDCRALLETIVRELHWILARPGDMWMKKVRHHLRTEYARPMDLADVAEFADMSRFAFVRKFKKMSGRTPMEELRRIRMVEARNLILSSDLPLKVIAAKVGIGDEYQLSKLFRKHFGVSPREIRRRPG